LMNKINKKYLPFCDDSSDGSDDEGTNNVCLEKQ